MTTATTYETHRRRAIEPNGTVHAARYAEDRQHFTTACAVYPAPAIDRLVNDEEVWSVSCPNCLTALAVIITCPLCKTPGAQEINLLIPGTDDYADCARCTACGHSWGLDPGANTACTECGGSSNTGSGTINDPQCPCSTSEENDR